MPEQRQTMQVGVGQKGTAPEGTETVETKKPAESEVSGRYHRMATVICPHCHAACDIIEETEYEKWFVCWNCSNSFRY